MWKPTLFCLRKILIFTIIISFSFSNFINTANAAAYSFTQTSWAGGVTANTATHASNQTGWTEYSASSGVAAGATATLTTTNYTFTDDGSVSLDPAGGATGGDFDNGTNLDTTVSGSDAGASISLTGDITADVWDNALESIPGTMGAGGSAIRNGTDDEIYVLQGGATTGFYKYSISGDSWTTLAVVPGSVTTGGQMIRNGSDNEIYVIRGSSTNFYRYSISGNSWTTLASTGVNISFGSQILRNGSDDYIYVLRGGNFTTFYRYSISGNSWLSMTAVPGGIGNGSQMIRNASDNEIYVLRGSGTGNFYSYSISGNSWSTLTSFPLTVSSDSRMIRNASDNEIYVLRGSLSTDFYRYSISGNSWTALTSVPGTIGPGNQMIRNSSNNDIYVMRGNSTNNFYKYSISGDSWTTLAVVPGVVGNGSSLLRFGSSSSIYAIQGGGTGLYEYTIEEVLYPASGTFISAVIDTAGNSNFGIIAYGAGTTLPDGTSVTFDVRAGNVAVPDETWTAYTTGIASGGSLDIFDGYRYIQYKINLATSVDTNTPTIDEVNITYSQYASSGTLTSSKFDSSFSTNMVKELTWIEEDTSETEIIKFQIRSSADDVTWSEWCGYDDCSGATYFITADGDNGLLISDDHPLLTGDNDRYFQYKAFFTSAGYLTPSLTSVEIAYHEPEIVVEEEVNSTSSGSSVGYRAQFFAKQALLNSSGYETTNNTKASSSCQINLLLKQGSRGEEVKCLQKVLGNLVADGIFGPKTKAAVMLFQKNHPPLVQDGIVGPKTRGVLQDLNIKILP